MHWFFRAEVVSLRLLKKRQQEDLLGAAFACICCQFSPSAFSGMEWGTRESGGKKLKRFFPNTRKKSLGKTKKKFNSYPI